LVDHGSIEGEQTEAREMASGARLDVGNQDVAESAPWGHRSVTGDEHLWGKTAVNAGRLA
jgi:hypothetical protein